MTVEQSPSFTKSNRMLALDVVRGFAMLLMLISHSSWWLDDLDYGVAYGWDNMIAPNLRAPESIIGFVLQLATPAFFLLGGFSIALFASSCQRKGWSEWRITRFLLTRGIVLIVLDLAVMNLQINPPYYSANMSVLTGMGISVCIMAWLRRLDWRGMVVLALVVLLGTQFYYYSLTAAGEWPREESVLRAVLLAPSVEDITWKTQFPALPWLPVVLLGFITATLVIRRGMSLGKLSLWLGMGCLALFTANMLIGDLWSLYPANPLIFGKHPPDFAYLSLYTGLAFLLIALYNRLQHLAMSKPRKVLVILGQSSLFFYIIHVRLIELVSPLVAPLQLPALERSLLIVLMVLPVAVLACAVYRLVKRKHPHSVLQYL